MKKIAALLVGHGSRRRGFDAAIKKVAARLRKNGGFFLVECAYLEVSEPSISKAIEKCVRQGATEVRVLPYFVLGGNHVAKDIPRIVAVEKKKHAKKSKILLSPYLGYHEKIAAVVKQRLQEGH